MPIQFESIEEEPPVNINVTHTFLFKKKAWIWNIFHHCLEVSEKYIYFWGIAFAAFLRNSKRFRVHNIGEQYKLRVGILSFATNFEIVRK